MPLASCVSCSCYMPPPLAPSASCLATPETSRRATATASRASPLPRCSASPCDVVVLSRKEKESRARRSAGEGLKAESDKAAPGRADGLKG